MFILFKIGCTQGGGKRVTKVVADIAAAMGPEAMRGHTGARKLCFIVGQYKAVGKSIELFKLSA